MQYLLRQYIVANNTCSLHSNVPYIIYMYTCIHVYYVCVVCLLCFKLRGVCRHVLAMMMM